MTYLRPLFRIGLALSLLGALWIASRLNAESWRQILFAQSASANSRFADQYNDDAFEKVQIGMSLEAVDDLLGKGLSEQFNCWPWRNEKEQTQSATPCVARYIQRTYSQQKDMRASYVYVSVDFIDGYVSTKSKSLDIE